MIVVRAVSAVENKKLILSWDDYFKLCDKLVHQLKNACITDIIAIARGGLIPAQYLAYKLNVKQIHSFGIITYSGDDKPLSDANIQLYQAPALSVCKSIYTTLIVDDIADSGRTLSRCMRVYPARVCTLYYKPTKSIIKPNYFAQTIENDTWVTFPYDNP